MRPTLILSLFGLLAFTAGAAWGAAVATDPTAAAFPWREVCFAETGALFTAIVWYLTSLKNWVPRTEMEAKIKEGNASLHLRIDELRDDLKHIGARLDKLTLP